MSASSALAATAGHATPNAVRAIALLAVFGSLVLACGNTSVALGGPIGPSSNSGASGAAGSAAPDSGLPWGYGQTGYGFGGFGGGWSPSDARGGSSAGGYPSSTGVDVCQGYKSDPAVDATTVDTCDAFTQGYALDALTLSGGTCWADQTPEATCSSALNAIDGGQCDYTKALVLKATGQATYGNSYELKHASQGATGWDWSGSEGLGLWVRTMPGTSGWFYLALWDRLTTPPGVVLDSATGGKSCYTLGDDWDLDGRPNVATPPRALLCQGWNVNVEVDAQWRFVLLPWSLWTNTNPTITKLGIDLSDVRDLQLYPGICSDFEVEIAAVGAYRARQ